VIRDLLLSPDPRTLSGDPASFAFGVQLLIGPAGGLGEESFELTVCSPEWLAERCKSGEPVSGLHHVVVGWDIYDERAFAGVA
jgi:Immunity protein 8